MKAEDYQKGSKNGKRESYFEVSIHGSQNEKSARVKEGPYLENGISIFLMKMWRGGGTMSLPF